MFQDCYAVLGLSAEITRKQAFLEAVSHSVYGFKTRDIILPKPTVHIDWIQISDQV